jgi:hypothetical protein
MRLLAITNFDENFLSIKNIVEPNNIQYFKKHNIEYISYYGDFDSIVKIDSGETVCVGKERNYWTKMILVHETLLNNDHDWIIMIDADCLMCDHTVDLRTIIKMAAPDKELLFCHIGDPLTNYWNINNGVFFVKNTQTTKDLFKDLISFAFNDQFNIDDQSVVQRMLKDDIDGIRKITEIFPSHTFNHGGNIIFHACGINSHHGDFKMALLEKERVLKSVLSEIKTI